jgi:hypothetical protein
LLHRRNASHQKYKLAVMVVCARGFWVGMSMVVSCGWFFKGFSFFEKI